MKRPDTPQVPEGWTVLRTKSYLASPERTAPRSKSCGVES